MFRQPVDTQEVPITNLNIKDFSQLDFEVTTTITKE